MANAAAKIPLGLPGITSPLYFSSLATINVMFDSSILSEFSGCRMELEKRLELITRPPTEEVVTYEELKTPLETEAHPIAYDGFEPSGLAHLPFGVLRA